MKEQRHAIMPIAFYQENGKYGIKDLDGDIIFYPIFDEIITSSDDLNYTSFVINGHLGYLILFPGSGNLMLSRANRQSLNEIGSFGALRHKELLFTCFYKDDEASDLAKIDEWYSGRNIVLNNQAIESVHYKAKAVENGSIKNVPTNSSKESFDKLSDFGSRSMSLIAPPANMVGATIFVEVYTYLSRIYHAAKNGVVPYYVSSFVTTVDQTWDNLYLLPRCFFGEGKFAEYLTDEILHNDAPKDIRYAFVKYQEK